MEFHQNGKWAITQLPEGGWQLEEQIRHEDQLGASILSSNLTAEDLLALTIACQSALGYENCSKCEVFHPANKHVTAYERWIRSLADYDNLLKRNKTDLHQAQFDASKKIITELLMLIDNIDAILNAVATRESGDHITAEEQQILRNSAEAVLTKNEVSPMFPGMKPLVEYDPEKHQAIEMVEGDVETTQVVPLFQGYDWRNRVLRTAQVRIVQPKKKVNNEQS